MYIFTLLPYILHTQLHASLGTYLPFIFNLDPNSYSIQILRIFQTSSSPSFTFQRPNYPHIFQLPNHQHQYLIYSIYIWANQPNQRDRKYNTPYTPFLGPEEFHLRLVSKIYFFPLLVHPCLYMLPWCDQHHRKYTTNPSLPYHIPDASLLYLAYFPFLHDLLIIYLHR